MTIWRGLITRRIVRNHPRDVFLFGDNLKWAGMGGMAREMRGEPNCVGLPTKKLPAMTPDSFFDDSDFINATMEMELAISRAEQLAARIGGKVYVPAGIGQGLARLPERAPKIWAWLKNRLGLENEVT